MGFGSDKTGFYKPSAVTVTASGNPLTLQSAKRLRKLTIYGNAVQDGTPSPDAPVEVQLCGDKTGNLLSMIDANPNTISVKSYSNGIIEVIGEASSSGGRTNRLSDYIILESNQTYTMVSYLVAGQTDSNIYVCLSRREDGTIYKSIEISAEKRTITIAPDENVELYLGINVTSGNCNSTLRVAIYKGRYTADTLPAYEPYGYKVSGRAEGLNLFNEKDFGAQTGVITNDDGSFTLSNKNTFTYDIRVESNSTYTLKTISNHQETYGNMLLRFLNEDKQEVSNVYLRSNNSPYVLQTGNINYIRISGTWSNRYTITFKNFQIVQGSYAAETMPPYEPYQPPQDFAVYLPEQIAKVGNVADEVVVDMERKTAELRKNVGINEFKSTDGWKNDWFPTIVKPLSPYGIANHRCISNYFDYNGDTSVPSVGITNIVGSTIGINRTNLISEVTDTDTFKAWLSDKNVYAYYPFATPVTTDITSLQQWDAMPQVSGTVTLTLAAEVEPSGAEAVYTASKRPKPQAALIEENTITEEPAETQVSDTDINTEIIMMED